MTTLSRSLLVATCLLVGTIAFAEEEKIPGSAEESTRIAEAWLTLVDDGQYNESWEAAGARFKAAVTSEKWAAAMEQVRRPLGRTGSRELLEANFTHEAPRAPKGDYWILRFATSFQGVDAHEFVTLTPDPDGAWRVVGFFIRPAN